MGTTASLCLIVRNEAAVLRTCLASVPGLFSEIVLADTGSHEDSVGVARSFGAKVVLFPWCDDFAAARNESLRHATGEWIFWLDADERLDETNGRKLRNMLESLPDVNAAYVMKQRSPTGSSSSATTTVDHVRLFRNRSEHRWEYRVHEQILPSLQRTGATIHWTDIVIDHSGYEDSALRRRKTDRNFRLLQLDLADRPDDPFTLFNYAWALMDLGRPAEALPVLRRCQERSHGSVSIAPLVYLLQAQCLLQLGRLSEAAAVCRAGRVRYPDDAELLFREGLIAQIARDHVRAEGLFRQLLQRRPEPPAMAPDSLPLLAGARRFVSVNEALHGHLTRHHLALSLRDMGRAAEAEEQWQAALEQEPHFGPARLEWAALLLAQRRWDELESTLRQFDGDPALGYEAALIHARALLARGEQAAAGSLLDSLIEARPDDSRPRVLRTHVRLQASDEPGAEAALCDVLRRDPRQVECWCNLVKLLRRQSRLQEAAGACQQALGHCRDDAELVLLHGLLLHDLHDLAGAEASLLWLLEIHAARRHADGSILAQRTAARLHLGQLYREEQRPADAEAQWRALLDDRPDYRPAWQELATLLREEGRHAESEEAERHCGGAIHV